MKIGTSSAATETVSMLVDGYVSPERPSRNTHYASKRWRSLGVLLILPWLVTSDATAKDPSDSFCRSMDESTSTWLDLRISATDLSTTSTVRDLVEALRQEPGIPLSFVEDDSGEPFSIPTEATTLDELLRAIAERHQHYQCEIIAGRLVLRSSSSDFDLMISGVDLTDIPRLPALNLYIEHLQGQDQRFKSWKRPLWAGVLESPVFEDAVTLSPRAPLIQHLVQLLGRDKSVYFDVPAARQPAGRGTLGARTIDIDAVASGGR